MKHGARSLLLLVVLAACGPGSQTDAERAADEARADSSAAGYEVGAPSVTSVASQDVDSISRSGGDSSGAGARTGAGQGNGGTSALSTRDTTRHPATSIAAAGGGRAGSGGSSSTSVASGPRGGRRDSTMMAPAPLNPALEPDFLAYDTTRKTVVFQLAATDELREQVSFNGAMRGGRTLTVPHGWRVTIAFANRDPQLPHSATIVDVLEPVPELLPEPVFPRAQTIRMEEGLLEGDADEITFAADRVGRYLIACGVLGHAQRGQWLTLNVSTTATKPNYR